MSWWQQLLLVTLPTVLGTGGLTALLTWRLTARKTEAEVADQDWGRFQREITRQDIKIVALSARIDELEIEVRACEEREGAQTAKIARLEAILQGRGEGLQHIQELISAARVKGDDHDGTG